MKKCLAGRSNLKKVFILCVMLLLLFATSCSKEYIKNSDDYSFTNAKKSDKEKMVDSFEMEGECNVYILDVGQGSSTVVQYKDEYMLIDGGDSDTSSYVVSFLKKQGIEDIDYVIATHYDADHLNGIVGVLNAFEIQTIISPDYTTTTKIYNSYVKTIENKNLKITYPEVGTTYSFGEAKFTIIAPNGDNYSNVNDYSVGIKFSFGNNSFIVCGDATSISENEMVKSGMDISADVYIVNHHGSTTSSSQEFIEKINPKYAVISVGEDNSYGHPAMETLKKLIDRNIDIYRTDKQGEICFTMSERGIQFDRNPYNDLEHVTEKKSRQDSEEIVNENEDKYVINKKTKKIHKTTCSSVKDIKEENESYFSGSLQEIIDGGYEKCKRCFR